MPLDPTTFARARRLDPAAVQQLLGLYYPAVYRLAHGLTGRADAGRKVVHVVMRRAMDRLTRWRSEDEPQRWFLHHSVLLTRRFARLDPVPDDDVLVRAAETPAPQYVAFVRALRKLAFQPREAIVLAHAEQLNARQLAVAMDCSTEAAANHLTRGRRELAAVVGGQLNVLLAGLERVYRSLTPDEHLSLPLVRRMTRRYVWPRRIGRWLRNLATVILLITAAYLAWRYGPLIDW
jgi:DNA-directed RNA polymerase specialized sigma24 family protein